jgi:hypothetical protein
MRPISGQFSAIHRYFPLKYTKYFCGKMPRLTKNALVIGHIAVFQTAPCEPERESFSVLDLSRDYGKSRSAKFSPLLICNSFGAKPC